MMGNIVHRAAIVILGWWRNNAPTQQPTISPDKLNQQPISSPDQYEQPISSSDSEDDVVSQSSTEGRFDEGENHQSGVHSDSIKTFILASDDKTYANSIWECGPKIEEKITSSKAPVEEKQSLPDNTDMSSAHLERFTRLHVDNPQGAESATRSKIPTGQSKFLQMKCNNMANPYMFISDNIITDLHHGPEVPCIDNKDRIPPFPQGVAENIDALYLADLMDPEPITPLCFQIPDICYERLSRVRERVRLHGGITVVLLPNNEVKVLGKNVTNFERDIRNAFEGAGLSKIDVCNIHTNIHGIRHTEFNSCGVAKMMFESGVCTSKDHTHCELILVAKDRGSGDQVIYTVVPAHFILTEQQTNSLDRQEEDMSSIREQFKQTMDDCKYVFKNENDDESFELLKPPLLAYRYWSGQRAITYSPASNATDISCQEEKCYPLMNDIALLKFEFYKSDPLANTLNIFPIPTKSHLDLLAGRQQPIMIGDLEGRLIHCPQSVGSGDRRSGLHLAYIITSKDSNGKTRKLKKGDSGLVVFLRGKQNQLFPVGMHVGRFSDDVKEFNSDIYQAVVLSQALKEIEYDYEDVISNIQLLETCHTSAVEMKPKDDTHSEDSWNASESDDEGSSGVGSEAGEPDDERYQVWYRHTGEEEIDDIPTNCEMKPLSLAEILDDIGSNCITHMRVKGGNIRSLIQSTRELQHLRVEKLNNGSHLQRICALKRLRTLNLSGNHFETGLPAGMKRLPDLHELNLMNCGLTNLPEWVGALPDLKILNLSNNNFESGLPESIRGLTSLSKLNLESCGLTTLPDGICVWPQLRTLNLSSNNLYSGLPHGLAYLSTLSELKLSSCQLSNLPEWLCVLTDLRSLDLSRNNFHHGLPPVVGELTALSRLNIESCQIVDLPTSLCVLTDLRSLDLSRNNFHHGLPHVVGELTVLSRLNIESCQLVDLPTSFSQLTSLEVLYLSGNDFVDIPSAVYSLESLRVLDMFYNRCLTTISERILQLSNLHTLHCYDCTSLTSPPYAVCQQGLSAVRDYFISLRAAEKVALTIVPVAIVGQKLAGKTSLVRSLVQGSRTLTDRTETSPVDETTKVFEVNDLPLAHSHARLIDHGGDSMYQLFYRYVLKPQNIPLFVINLVEFSSLSSTSSLKDATKTTCWDWMSHLYLHSPLLGPPILVLTHADKLSPGDVTKCREDILRMTEVIREEMLAEEVEQFGPQHRRLNQIVHLSNKEIPIFNSEDIFVFSNDESETSNIEALKVHLDRRCVKFTSRIPQLWEDVHRFIRAQQNQPFVDLSEIQSKYPGDGCQAILRYLHHAGDILWFEHAPALRQHIFHQIPKMTEMINVLFHHRSEEQWKQRLDTFTAFRHEEQMMNKAKFEDLCADFGSSGVIDEALLVHLLKSESEFPPAVALELLQCFNIVHGPIGQSPRKAYVIPYFATSDMDKSWETDGHLQLRLDIKFCGLSLPAYGYQLATVAVLNKMMSPSNTFIVAKNGVTVYHGECATHLIHSSEERNITLQVSTDVEHLGNSWKCLLGTAKDIIELLSNTWIACQPSVRVYCLHCLFLRDLQPGYSVDPDWFHPISRRDPTDSACTDVDVLQFSRVESVTCKRQAAISKSNRPTVPKALLFPCYQPTADEINKLNSYLTKLESKRPYIPAERVQYPTQPQTVSEEEDSELSDSIEYLDERYDVQNIRNLVMKQCIREDIRQLYDSDSVYMMSAPTRGRCLVINNFTFPRSGGRSHDRQGSEKDEKDIQEVFQHLSFKCDVIERDLASQRMMEVIQRETEHPHHTDYGMFVLVIMSHGSETHISGSDGGLVERAEIFSALSAQRFPAMAGKPKLIILQACSGGRYDTDTVPPTTYSSVVQTLPTSTSPPSAISTSPDVTITVPAEPSTHFLVGDDLFIMRSSFWGYVSIRNTTHGAWFIQAIVEALYKHSCHRDIKTIFEEQVTKKVRLKGLATSNVYPRQSSRQLPVVECHPTKGRKLYLFPGYNPTI